MYSDTVPASPFNTQALPLPVATLSEVRTGKASPFTREQLSAINKSPIKQPMAVNYLGLVNDEQADRRHHGGYLKAVHQMSTATYTKLNDEFGLQLEVGALGENLTTLPLAGMPDLTESTVCIGDIYQYGDPDDCVHLKVVQPRRPCYKINDQIALTLGTKLTEKVGKRNIAAWITNEGLAGWYFQVVRDGIIKPNIPVYLIKRPYPFATLASLWALVNQKGKVATAVIEPWLNIDSLEESWKKALRKKIA